jgi:hypothetical protein
LHSDAVVVSGANEYRVNPRPLVTTVTPPMFAVFSAALDPAEPAAGVEPLAGVLPPEDELPHAAAPIATAAIPAAAAILIRTDVSLAPFLVPTVK